MTRKLPPRPRYHNTYPPELATADELALAGLKPGSPRPVAILDYEDGDRSGMCGLHERSAAVPRDTHREAS